jgi:predicted nucleic acid-binding protein
MSGLAAGADRWAMPWPCVHEFLAIATHARIYAPPTPLETALRAVGVWLASPSCQVLAEGEGYFRVLSRLLTVARCTGPAVHDARVAALCLHYGVLELWTADRDFGRFPGLKVRNPLIPRR